LGGEEILISKVYPNPIQNELTIDAATQASEVTIHVYDMRGKMIDLPITMEGSSARINSTELPSGLYTLQITNNLTVTNQVHRFVKQ
jgi:formate-dependent phosphoribosylglycinamide formyltransferase (GAR transformylase)